MRKVNAKKANVATSMAVCPRVICSRIAENPAIPRSKLAPAFVMMIIVIRRIANALPFPAMVNPVRNKVNARIIRFAMIRRRAGNGQSRMKGVPIRCNASGRSNA